MMGVYHNIDCMDPVRGLPSFPDNHFDLAIVDPPYGIGYNMNAGRRKGERKKHKDKEWDNSIPAFDYFEQLARVSRNQIVWGGNYFRLPPVQSWIVWDKGVPVGVSFSKVELAWSSFGGSADIVRITYSGFQGKEACRIHPTQKPVALYRWLLSNYAKEGDKIIDTHVGSASSLIAFEEQGFEYIGYELDEEYYQESTKRLGDLAVTEAAFQARADPQETGTTQNQPIKWHK